MKRGLFLVYMLLTVLLGSAQYRDVKLPDAPKQSNYRDYENQNSGFWCAADIEGGSSVMANYPNMQYAGASFSGGYRFNEYIRVGVGFGLRYYVHNAYVRNASREFGFPVFANVRGNFISAVNRDGVPFWSFNIGGITGEGFFASPTLGYSFGGLRHNFQIGISYTISSFKSNWQENLAYSYFGLKLGYEF